MVNPAGKKPAGKKPGGKIKPRVTKDSLPPFLKAYHEDLDILTDHPLLRAVKRPNPVMTQWHLFAMTVASMCLTGRAYWWFRHAEEDQDWGDDRPQIWPVPASWITAKHQENKLFHHWELQPGGAGQPIPIPAEQIAYVYYPDPANPLGALSPLSTMARAVIADEAIAEAQRRAFTNGIFPGHAVVIGRVPDMEGKPGERPMLSREQRAAIQTAIKQAYRGVVSYDEPVILDAFIEDVKRLTVGVREMDFTASGKYTKERITQTYGVNPITLGQIEGANRASAVAARENLYEVAVNPLIELFSQCLTAWAAPVFSDDQGEVIAYIEACRAEDPDLMMAEENLLGSKGGMTINEMRQRHSLPPLEPEFGDVVWMPPGVVPIHVLRVDQEDEAGYGAKTLTEQMADHLQGVKPPPPPPPVVVPGLPAPGQAPAKDEEPPENAVKPPKEPKLPKSKSLGERRGGHPAGTFRTWPYRAEVR